MPMPFATMPAPARPLPPAPTAGPPRRPPRRFQRPSVVVAALAVALAAAPAAAAVYKWVDANGRVVYSDQPPPPSVKSETVRDVPPPANPNAAKELEEQEAARRQAEKKKQEAAAAAEKARVEAEQKRDLCQSARGQLATLMRPEQPLYKFNEKGEQVPMNDQMRRAEIERTQLLIQNTCRTP